MMMTYEEEEVKQIPFLDALLVRREDGSVKLLVYRTKLHTDQYLNFSSHHPLNHKLAGIRTLLERCYSIVTEEHDRKKEEEHFAKALRKCGYPPWTINNNNNNNNNNEDNVYGAVIMAEPLREFTRFIF